MRIIKSRLLVSKGYAYTLFQTIFIHPESPEYLIAHEAVHVQQQRDDGLIWYWRYLFDSDWRLAYEIHAHRAAVDAGQPLSMAAAELWSNYGTGIGYAEAVSLLMESES